MYGEGMGTLNVYTQLNNDFAQATLRWTRNGNAGQTWRLSRVTIPAINTNFKVRLPALLFFLNILPLTGQFQ